jgi:hypothetical protein
MSTSSTFVSVTVRGLELENDTVVVSTAAAGLGAQASTPLPNNAAFVITKRSLQTGKSARGRFYWGGIPQNALGSVVTITQGFADGLVEMLEALLALLQAINWVLVIVSRYSNGVKRTEGLTFQIASFEARNTLLDSQRGRLAEGH